MIALIDDDCEAPPNWLHELADAFAVDRRIGIVFGNVMASQMRRVSIGNGSDDLQRENDTGFFRTDETGAGISVNRPGGLNKMAGFLPSLTFHTLTHPDLTRLPLDQTRSQICDSKSIVEDALSSPVTCFAYPYGRQDDRVRELVREHFSCACSDKSGLVTPRSDLYSLERIDACYFPTHRLFGVVSTGWFPSYIWARNIPISVQRAFQRSRER